MLTKKLCANRALCLLSCLFPFLSFPRCPCFEFFSSCSCCVLPPNATKPPLAAPVCCCAFHGRAAAWRGARRRRIKTAPCAPAPCFCRLLPSHWLISLRFWGSVLFFLLRVAWGHAQPRSNTFFSSTEETESKFWVTAAPSAAAAWHSSMLSFMTCKRKQMPACPAIHDSHPPPPADLPPSVCSLSICRCFPSSWRVHWPA